MCLEIISATAGTTELHGAVKIWGYGGSSYSQEWTSGNIGQIVYASAGAVIFSFYIVYDTQLIIGGNNRRIQYSVDDYALAAINLYLDIINLFMAILEIIDGR